jgi:hypothetical protein
MVAAGLQKYKRGMFCFSPPVMLATLILEVALAIYTVWRYKWNNTIRLVATMLVFLATFQLAEYMVCQVTNFEPLFWSRVGYVAITLLPPLGIHLAYELAGAKKRPLLPVAYGAAALFVLFFAFVSGALGAQACLGNYVIFETAPGSSWLYTGYYYGLLLLGVGLCYKLAKGLKHKGRRHALAGLAIGYCTFLIPTTLVNLLDHSTIAGIPSIMCGFAVLLALTLALWILPLVGKKK